MPQTSFAGATSASSDVAVDAGELSAGDSKPTAWARKFTNYSAERGRNGHYDVLTIHGYSAEPDVFVKKIREYQALRGVGRRTVSEFAWAVGKHNSDSPGGEYKCTTESGQRVKFKETVKAVRDRTSGVDRLVWLDVVDRRETKEVNCLDNTRY